jgi:hypothetical protein
MLDWNGAVPPFRIAGNVHCFGTNGEISFAAVAMATSFQ